MSKSQAGNAPDSRDTDASIDPNASVLQKIDNRFKCLEERVDLNYRVLMVTIFTIAFLLFLKGIIG